MAHLCADVMEELVSTDCHNRQILVYLPEEVLCASSTECPTRYLSRFIQTTILRCIEQVNPSETACGIRDTWQEFENVEGQRNA